MKAPVATHDWSAVEAWFKSRAEGNWAHSEEVDLSGAIAPEVSALSERMAFEAGKRIGELWAR